MSTIDSVNGINSSLYTSLLTKTSTVTATTSTDSTNAVTGVSSTSDEFSAALNGLTGGGSGSGSSDSSDEETTTITKTLADGSMLVMVMQGNEVISEQKVSAGNSNNNNVAIQNGQAMQMNGYTNTTDRLLDRFNDTAHTISAGSLFTANV